LCCTIVYFSLFIWAFNTCTLFGIDSFLHMISRSIRWNACACPYM
jgi:hypothetical protein